MTSKPANPVGRPRKLTCDEATLEKLKVVASGQHTQLEAAAIFGVSIRTFEEFLRVNEKAREIWDLGEGNGKASLRRMQFMSAQKGNVTMQIWLGKQYLNQTDKQEQTIQAGESLRELWARVGERRQVKVIEHG